MKGARKEGNELLPLTTLILYTYSVRPMQANSLWIFEMGIKPIAIVLLFL